MYFRGTPKTSPAVSVWVFCVAKQISDSGICYMYTCKTMADPLRVCSIGRSSERPSTVGEQINQINGNDVLALFTALYGPQHCSFTNRTEQTKSWPLFGASFAAIRRRKDREMMKLLQIWASTIGLGPNVKLQPCHKATRVLPKLLSNTIVAPLDTFDSPAKYDIPCNMQPLQ